MARTYGLGVIGLGKIAQDQHLPVIAQSGSFELIAVSSQRGLTVPGVAHAVRTPGELLAIPDVEAVAICTPPQARYAIARDALAAGKHVMLEKPPTATSRELADLIGRADAAGRVLMTTWHSQHNAAVDEAKRLLTGGRTTRLLVNWKEDVRKWHPGQRWVFEPGGFGVFDPGINALSILTKILPEPIFVTAADLFVPNNADAPIAASLTFFGPDHHAEFDWRQEGDEVWEIEVDREGGPRLRLPQGGTRLLVDGVETVAAPSREYQSIYARFGELLSAGTSAVDSAPFQLAADAFLLGRRREVEAFNF